MEKEIKDIIDALTELKKSLLASDMPKYANTVNMVTANLMDISSRLENFVMLAEDIHRNAIDKGFWKPDSNTAEKLMLIVSELSEAMEADRKGRFCQDKVWDEMEHYKNSSENNWMCAFEAHIKDTFEDELADAFIRLLDLSTRYRIDLLKHVEAKHRYNKLRPFLHGKKY